jgi:hypothetical protein
MTEALSLSQVHRNAAGWFRGDFHCHTHHSDGVYSPPELLALARAEGLEFFAITDHNMVEAYGGFGEQGGLLIIPGIEVSYKDGHYNVFGLEQGAQEWVDGLRGGKSWRDMIDGGDDELIGQLLQFARAQGWLNSPNHPMLKPWSWLFSGTDLRLVDCLEVWNDPSWPENKEANPEAVALWTRLLDGGYRITAIGGSDFHRPVPEPGQAKPPEHFGVPSTYVYAEELSGAAILAGVRAHRAYVSMGPQASFAARVGEQEAGIGADLGPLTGEVVLHGAVHASPRPGTARIVRGGAHHDELAQELQAGDCALEWRAQVKEGEWGWFRLEAWDTDGQLLVVTNPVFFGPQQTPERTRFGDFV